MQRMGGWFEQNNLAICKEGNSGGGVWHLCGFTIYHIISFFMGSYLHFLVLILVKEIIFVKEKFVYRWPTKKLTMPVEVLFSARLAEACGCSLAFNKSHSA